MSKEVRPDTLDFIYEHVRDAPAEQKRSQESLDSKMVQIFGAASIVIGLAGVTSRGLNAGDTVNALLVGAVLAYVVAAVMALLGLRTRKFRRTFHADELWRYYWRDEPTKIKHALVDDISKSYVHNREILRDKARMVSLGLAAAGVEVVLVALALIWSRLA